MPVAVECNREKKSRVYELFNPTDHAGRFRLDRDAE